LKARVPATWQDIATLLFVFPFIPVNGGSLHKTQPYLQLLQLCSCWASFSLLLSQTIPNPSLPGASVASQKGPCDSHFRDCYQSPAHGGMGAHPLPSLRCCMNFLFFLNGYLIYSSVELEWIFKSQPCK